jgi:hypothetical protein
VEARTRRAVDSEKGRFAISGGINDEANRDGLKQRLKNCFALTMRRTLKKAMYGSETETKRKKHVF